MTSSAPEPGPRTPPGGGRPFEIQPAIDLRGGRVVRLAQGDYGRETAYGDDPAAVARTFVAQGTRWIHVVDLDGARAGEPRQAAVVAAIVAAAGPDVAVQVAGGLRTDAAVEAALAAGAARVVLGTAALAEPRFAGRLVDLHGPARVAVALDVRDGLAVGEGWRQGAPGRPVAEVLGRLAQVGVERFVVTAIARDGLLEGPDLALLGGLVDLGGGAIVASGGIGRVADVTAVRELGCAGVVIGRAIYEGRIDLAALVRGG